MGIFFTLAKQVKSKLNSIIKATADFAGEHLQIVKVSGMAVGIILCSLMIAAFFTTGYEVYLNGEKVAIVEEKEDFLKAFETANEKIASLVGEGYEIINLPKFVFTVAPKTGLTLNDKIVDNVMMQSNAISKFYVINVDGQDIAFAKSEEAAKSYIDKATSIYSGENKQILNDVKIESRFEAIYYLTDEKLAVNLLKNVLRVQTEKTSVYNADLMYGTIKNPTDELYVNEEKVSSEGQKGVMEVTAKVTEVNGAVSGTTIISSQVINEPVNEVVMVGTMQHPSVGTGEFLQPYFGTITSRFGARWGRKHTGTDICGDVGDPISATDNGIVVTAEYQKNGYGNIVIIDHQNGIQTWYAHLDSISVNVGDVVEKGKIIGKLGNTGYSTGPHLHFEVRENGIPVNPSNYLSSLK
ncbi:MAG: peptidoglycan DD-metalloendopeptidase family protein [Monoglobales bacterium]